MRLSILPVVVAVPCVATADDGFTILARQMRQAALSRASGMPVMAPGKRVSLTAAQYPWHHDITTTVFWCGESAASGGGVANDRSAWDALWAVHFGGVDTPARRSAFLPAGFIPRRNPFYCALPYCDMQDGKLKPEASKVVPWFAEAYRGPDKSVCWGRWVAIECAGRVCYAQWANVGPFRTDHWKYVFGNERPLPNPNHDAGLDVSPAVKDYLGLHGEDRCSWRFVSANQVPPGPWSSSAEALAMARK